MDKEEKVQLGLAVGSVAAFVLGFRRLAGAIVLYDGYRAYQQSAKPHAAFSATVGGAFLLFPTWPESVRDAVSGTKTTTTQLPPPAPIANYASLTSTKSGGDELFMGNWTLYDVAETQTPEIAARAKTMKPGDTAALVLGQPGAPPLVFKARVIPGGTPGRYIGQWVTQKPVGGPEFADFAANHVLVVT
jgi:hypothetical protein